MADVYKKIIEDDGEELVFYKGQNKLVLLSTSFEVLEELPIEGEYELVGNGVKWFNGGMTGINTNFIVAPVEKESFTQLEVEEFLKKCILKTINKEHSKKIENLLDDNDIESMTDYENAKSQAFSEYLTKKGEVKNSGLKALKDKLKIPDYVPQKDEDQFGDGENIEAT